MKEFFQILSSRLLKNLKKLFFDCVNDNKIDKEKQWHKYIKQKKIPYWRTSFNRIDTLDLKQVMQDPKKQYII